MIAFRVYGIPVTQGSMSAPRAGVVIHKETRELKTWRKTVLVAAMANGYVGVGPAYEEGPWKVELVFWLPRPRTVKRAMPTARFDLDKLQRAVLDALTGYLWFDDGQVVECHAWKRYADDGEKPGVEIRVTPL